MMKTIVDYMNKYGVYGAASNTAADTNTAAAAAATDRW